MLSPARLTRPFIRLLRGVFALTALMVAWPTQAVSQGPVADGPYVGSLPCPDCTGIRTVLTLYSTGQGGAPLAYRMTLTYLGTPDGDRTEERMGPWLRLNDSLPERVRIEPFDDTRRQTFRRVDAATLMLLDRDDRPIAAARMPRLVRDASSTLPPLEATRTLFRGTLVREEDRLYLTPCTKGRRVRVHDVSPEVIITAAITDIGFDRVSGMYLEAYGRMQDGALMIDRLNRAGIEMGCPKEPVGMSAQGNEPGWRVVSGRRAVSFTRLGEATITAPPIPLSWRWPQGRHDRPEASLTLATESAALRAVLTPKLCRDSMADAVYGMTAVVRVSRPEPARDYRGCAYLGSEGLP